MHQMENKKLISQEKSSTFDNLNTKSQEPIIDKKSVKDLETAQIYNFFPSNSQNNQDQQQQATPYLEASNKKARNIITQKEDRHISKPIEAKKVDKKMQQQQDYNEKEKSQGGIHQYSNQYVNGHNHLNGQSQYQQPLTHQQQQRSYSTSSEQPGLAFPFFNNYFVKTFKDYDERDYQKKVIERIELIHDGKKMTLYDKLKEIMIMRHKQQQPINNLMSGNINSIDVSAELPYVNNNSDYLDKFVFPGCFFQDQNMYFDIQISKCTWGQQDQNDGLIVILNDISQRVTNQRLKQLDKYKDDLLASVSHDFKTPLNGMASQLQLIQSLLKNLFSYPKKQDGLCSQNVQQSIIENENNLDEQLKKSTQITQGVGSSELKNQEKLQQNNQLIVQKEDQIQVSDMIGKYSGELDDLKSQIFNYLYQVEQNVWLLNHLVNDIQDYSQMNNQTLRINISPFRLLDVVNDVQNLMKIQSDAKGIAFEVKSTIPLEQINLNSDKIRLKQILINLLSNALKFTYEGFVKLEIDYVVNEEAQQCNTLQFSVSDTGIGMSEAVQSNLFKMYSSFDTNKINKHGVGLGLFISKCLVTLLGPFNEIQVESGEGKGSVFKFQVYQNLDLSKKRRGTAFINNHSFAKTNKSENNNNYTVLYHSNTIGMNTPQNYAQSDHQHNIFNCNSPNLNSFSLKKITSNSNNVNTNNINNNSNNNFNNNNNNPNANNVNSNLQINNNYSQFREPPRSSSQLNTPSSLKQQNLRKQILSNNNNTSISNIPPPPRNTSSQNNGSNGNNIEVSKFVITPDAKYKNKVHSKNDLQIQQQYSPYSNNQEKLYGGGVDAFDEGCDDNDSQQDRQINDLDDTIAADETEGVGKNNSKYFAKNNIKYQQNYLRTKSAKKVQKWGFVQTKYKSETCISNQNQANSFSNHRLMAPHHKVSSSSHSNTIINSNRNSVIFSATKINLENKNNSNLNNEIQYTLLKQVSNNLPQNSNSKPNSYYQKQKSLNSKIQTENQKYSSRNKLNNQLTEATFILDLNQSNNISERMIKESEKEFQKKRQERENLPTITSDTDQNLIGNRSFVSTGNFTGQYSIKIREDFRNKNLLFTNQLSNETLSSDEGIQEGTKDEYHKQQSNFQYINSQIKPKTLLQLVEYPQEIIDYPTSPLQLQEGSPQKWLQAKPSSHILKDKGSIPSNDDIHSTESIDLESLQKQRNSQMFTPVKINKNLLAQTPKKKQSSHLIDLGNFNQPNLIIPNQYSIYASQENDILNPMQQQLEIREQIVDESHIICNTIEHVTQNSTQQRIKIRSIEFKELTSKVLPDRKLRLLYAEDEPFSVVAIKNFLREYEKYIELTVAFNGQLALQKIIVSNEEQKPFDAVFMDSNMPVMDGPETIQQIRKLIDKKTIKPLIIITCTSYTDKQRYIDLGSDSFLSKPTNLQSILESLIFIIQQIEGNQNKSQ